MHRAAGRSLPLWRMLAVSTALHLALLGALRPVPVREPAGPVVLEARLEMAPVDVAAAPPDESAPAAGAGPAVPAVAPAPAGVTPVMDSPLPPAPPARGLATAAPATLSPAPVAEISRPVSPSVAPPVPAPTPSEQMVVASPVVASASHPAVAVSLPAPSGERSALAAPVDPEWYEARALDRPPVARAAIKPAYPPKAQRQGLEGMVKLRLRVDEFGVVREVEVVEANPPGVFDRAALEAFQAGRFTPARKDGRDVRAEIYIQTRFTLE